MVRAQVCGVLGWLGAALALSACMQTGPNQSTTFLDLHAESNPTLASFRECHGFACAEQSRASLSAKQWQQVAAAFKPPAKDARAERRQIAQAVTVIRRAVGAQTGTGVHQWTHKDMIILPNVSDKTQLDCIDEAVNTWTYMTLMEKGRLLRFHRVAQLSNASSVTGPRNTAVLQETGSSAYFAIDPSLVDFGELPPVIPLATWLGEWPPDLSQNDAREPAKPKPVPTRQPRVASQTAPGTPQQP